MGTATNTFIDYSREQWDDYYKRFRPVEDSILGYDPAKERAKAFSGIDTQTNGAFNSTQGTLERQRQGLGIQADTAQRESDTRRLGLARVLANVDAKNRASMGITDNERGVQQFAFDQDTAMRGIAGNLLGNAAGLETQREITNGQIDANAQASKLNSLGKIAGIAYDVYDRWSNSPNRLSEVVPSVSKIPTGTGPASISSNGLQDLDFSQSLQEYASSMFPDASRVVGNYTFSPGYDFLGGTAAIPNGLQAIDYSDALQDYASSSMDRLNGQLSTDPNMAGRSALSNYAQGIGGALGIYGGLKQGGVVGGLQTAGGAAQLASAAGYGGSTLANAVPVIGALTGGYGTVKAIQAGDVKGGVASGASTGAAIGSVVPGIGTAVGAVIGGIVGGIGALIHGKDYKEEKVRDKYYDAVKQGMTWDTSEAFGLSPEGFYQSMAGEFRGSRSKYPPRASGKYGQKDEDVFVADLANKINSAYAAGAIGPNDDAASIMQKVVEPWFQQEMGGWRSDPRYPTMVQEQKTLTMDLINRYIHGEPVEWAVIKGGSRDHPVPQYLGLQRSGINVTIPSSPIPNANPWAFM